VEGGISDPHTLRLLLKGGTRKRERGTKKKFAKKPEENGIQAVLYLLCAKKKKTSANRVGTPVKRKH